MKTNHKIGDLVLHQGGGLVTAFGWIVEIYNPIDEPNEILYKIQWGEDKTESVLSGYTETDITNMKRVLEYYYERA